MLPRPDTRGPIGDRAKQYAGDLFGTVGGITLSIDLDVVAGPVAR